MMRLQILAGYTPFANPRDMTTLLFQLLPERVSGDITALIWYSFRILDYQGLAESVPFISPAAFLAGEVRYHLDCDAEEQIITEKGYAKLKAELDSLIAIVGGKTI